MVAAPVAPLPSGTVAEEEEEKKAARRQEEAATTTTTKSVDRESIPSTTLPSPSSCSSSLVPNQRVRVRGVPATVRYVGPVAGKDPADTWIGLEWDDAAASSSSSSSSEGRGKHDGSVGGVRYFRTRGARRKGSPAPMTGSLVRAAALDAPGVLVVGCSVEEALVRRYRGSSCDDESENGVAGSAATHSPSPPPAPLPSSSSSSSSSFVAGHEEVAARLARIHELEVASVAGSPAAFCLEEEEDRGDGGGGGRRGNEAPERAAARKESPLVAPLGELAPSLRALDAAGCLFAEWREIERILRALPGLERLDLTRCGGLAAAAEVVVVVEEEGEENEKSSSSSLPLPPRPPPRLPAAPLRGLRELVLAETGTEWTDVLSALAGSGVRALRALSLRRCGLRCLGGGGDGGGDSGGGGGSGPAGRNRSRKLLVASVLSRLEELDLSENDLSCWWGRGSGEEGEDGRTGIADELGELPRLSTLDLSRNPLLSSLSSSFLKASLRPQDSSRESSSSSPSFAALEELRLAECGLSSWAELDCLFEEEEGEEESGEGQKATAAAAAKNSVLPFPCLSSLRLSGNPLPAPDPSTGCARADVVARLRMGISSLNGARVGVRERADARRALEAARRRTRLRGEAAVGVGGASLAGLSLGGKGGDSSSSVLPPLSTHSLAGIMAPMAASMLELRIVLSTEEKEEPLPSSSSTSAKAAAATTATKKKATPPVRLPGSTTVTRLRQLAARLTGVPAREQVLRIEMGGSGEKRGRGGGGGGGGEGGGCAAAAAAAAADDGDDDGSDSVVLLELTPADDSRDLRFLGVSSGSVVRVSRS